MNIRSLSLILLVAFLSIAVFGFLGIGHQTGCLARLADRPMCPPQHNDIDLTIFHVDAFQKFSKATVGMAMLFLAVLFLFVITAVRSSVHHQLLSFFSITLFLVYSFSRSERSHWLALFEHSPAPL